MDPLVASVILLVGRLNGKSVEPLGTSFAVGPNLFATAAHVTGQNETNLVLIAPRFKSMLEYQDNDASNLTVIKAVITKFDPVRDIAILHAPDITAQFPYRLEGSDSAAPGTEVISVGFPHANHGRAIVTQQSSTVGARVLLEAGPLKVKHIVLNIQTRPGQSGSPVFLRGENRVCAMVTGSYAPGREPGIMMGDVDPRTLHQTSHAVSVEYIGAML